MRPQNWIEESQSPEGSTADFHNESIAGLKQRRPRMSQSPEGSTADFHWEEAGDLQEAHREDVSIPRRVDGRSPLGIASFGRLKEIKEVPQSP